MRLLSGPWRRRLLTGLSIVLVEASVLAITYHAVVFQGRTLLTGAALAGTEGTAVPYGYPGASVHGFNEVDPGASAWQYVPQMQKAHDELARGELPLWDANVMLGVPLAADPIHGVLNPLTWPLLAHPTAGAWDAWLLVRLLLAGVLCTYLAMYLGLRPVPATVAGLIFMMSGALQLRTTTIQTSVVAILPLVLLAVECCVRRPTRWSAGLLAVAIAAMLLFGMPEQAFVCVLLSAVYFLVRFGAQWTVHRRPPWRALYAAAGGGVVGVLLSLPVLVPFAEYLSLGATSHTTAYLALGHADPGQLLSLVGPHWNVVGPRFPATGAAPFDNWFGAGALLLALIGTCSRDLPRGVRTLLVVTALVVEAKVVGFPGWFNQFVGNLPILNRIALWSYLGAVVSLAVALLAGAGLQRIARRDVTRREIVACSVALLGLIAIAAPSFLRGTAVRWDQVLVTTVALLILVASAVLAVTSRRARGFAVTAAASVVAVELILLATPQMPEPLRYYPLTPTPASQYLQEVMPSGVGRSYSSSQVLYPTTNQAFNVDDIRDLDAIYPERSYRYLKDFVVPGLTDRFDGVKPNLALVNGNPFFDALNVEYILVAPLLSAHQGDLANDQFVLQQTAADGVGIFRNLHAAPRAQVVFATTTVGSENAAVAAMSRPGFDPTRQAVVETPTALPDSSGAPTAAPIERYDDNRVTIATSTARPGLLVLADAYYPGWQAKVDGKPAAIYPVDVAFRGVPVPAGAHVVTMEYRPQSFTISLLGVPAGLVLFSLGGWGLPAAAHVVRRRRLVGVAGPAERVVT